MLDEFFTPIHPLLDYNVRVEEFLSETTNYMKDIVAKLLSNRPENFNGLSFLLDLINDKSYNSIDIFTLNHDTVIEEFLNSTNKTFCDGFGEEKDGYKFWDVSLFDFENRIRLYKLHGSVNWYWHDNYSWEDRRICKCSNEVLWRRGVSKPILLIGTYNKLPKYTSGIYLELFWQFYKTLNNYSVLVVIGYSFGDRGINDKIFDWLLTHPYNKMVIVDPYVDDLRDKMHSALYSKWDKNESIVPIKNYAERIIWKQIEEYL